MESIFSLLNENMFFSFAAVLPDALKTACGSCTQIQKEKALDVVTRLYYDHPDMYLALAERYDPTGEYTKRFEDWFDQQNVLKPRQPINREGNQFVTRTTQAGARRTANSVQRNPNEIRTERTRIPSTWITSTTIATTTSPRPRPSRPTLRTLPPTVRTATQRILPPEALAQTATTLRPQTISLAAPTTVRQVSVQRNPTIFRDPTTTRFTTSAPIREDSSEENDNDEPPEVFLAPSVQQSSNVPDTRGQNPSTFRENPPLTRATTFAPPTTRIFPPTQQNSFNQQLPQFIPQVPSIRVPQADVRPPPETFVQPPRLPELQVPVFVPTTTQPPTQRTFPTTQQPTQRTFPTTPRSTTSFIPQTPPPTQRTFPPVQQSSFNQQTPQFVQSMQPSAVRPPPTVVRPPQETFVQPQPVSTMSPTFRTTQAPLPPVRTQAVNRPQPEIREPDAFRPKQSPDNFQPQQNPERSQPVSS